MKKRPMIDENKLFKHISKLFPTVNEMIDELWQNSQRANATTIKMDLNGQFLTYEDNGKGVIDPYYLMSIATSDWDDRVMQQDPFGVGFMSLIAHCDTVALTSIFGTLTINTEKFKNDSEYRGSLLSSYDKANKLKTGVKYMLYLNNSAAKAMDRFVDDATRNKTYKGGYYKQHYYSKIDIWINGSAIYRIDPSNVFPSDSNTIRYDYHGNDVVVQLDGCTSSMDLVWYGQRTVVCAEEIKQLKNVNVWMFVFDGSPLDLAFPSRTNVVRNDKFADFITRLYNEIAKHIEQTGILYKSPQELKGLRDDFISSVYNYKKIVGDGFIARLKAIPIDCAGECIPKDWGYHNNLISINAIKDRYFTENKDIYDLCPTDSTLAYNEHTLAWDIDNKLGSQIVRVHNCVGLELLSKYHGPINVVDKITIAGAKRPESALPYSWQFNEKAALVTIYWEHGTKRCKMSFEATDFMIIEDYCIQFFGKQDSYVESYWDYIHNINYDYHDDGNEYESSMSEDAEALQRYLDKLIGTQQVILKGESRDIDCCEIDKGKLKINYLDKSRAVYLFSHKELPPGNTPNPHATTTKTIPIGE